MGRQSTRENKNIYQLSREECGLTREKASERMEGISAAREVEVSELSGIILETIASLNEIHPLTNRLIQIARDGQISDDEIHDFAHISTRLDEVALAVQALNLWVERTAGENGLNMALLEAEKEKFRKSE